MRITEREIRSFMAELNGSRGLVREADDYTLTPVIKDALIANGVAPRIKKALIQNIKTTIAELTEKIAIFNKALQHSSNISEEDILNSMHVRNGDGTKIKTIEKYENRIVVRLDGIDYTVFEVTRDGKIEVTGKQQNKTTII